MAAVILALFSLYSTCWYAPYQGLYYIIPIAVVLLFLYFLFLAKIAKQIEVENL